MPATNDHKVTPRIVFLSGGSGCRSINIELCKKPAQLTRIVPVWDSGGSSRVLRERLDIPPVGDIRQALMTMAHGEGRSGYIVRLCNSRLSDQVDANQLKAEFDFFNLGHHPFLQKLEPEVRRAISAYLNAFNSHMPPGFDLQNGSIGNFILAGAYFSHGHNINTAISIFRDICEINGNVWPVSLANDAHLSARLSDGRQLNRQHHITSLGKIHPAVTIEALKLENTAGESTSTPFNANEAAIDAIRSADLIVYGPGSLFTSILPHFLVNGIVDAIAEKDDARKILIGNITECAETRGLTLEDQLLQFFQFARPSTPGKTVLTHVLHNRNPYPFLKKAGSFNYLQNGRLLPTCDANGVVLVTGDFEDTWNRGVHDGKAIANEMIKLAGGTTP